MVVITFQIQDADIQRIIDAMKGLYPIPIDPDTGEPVFTDNQWAKESVRRWVRDQVARWEQKIARDAIGFSPQDDIIT